MSRWLSRLVAAISGFAMFFSAWSMSYVYNENGRLASGLRYLETGDFSSFHVNPPLVSLVGAIPAAVGGASCPTRVELGIANFARDEYRAGRLFLTKNPNHRIFLFFGRLCCIVLVLVGLWTTFRFAAASYGAVSGFIFLLLGAFSPYTLGYGALIVPDVSAAFLGAASVFFFWRWLRSPEVDAAFLAGCALGLAELTKFTLLIFYPLFVVMWAIYRIPHRSSDAELKRQSPLRRQALQLCMIFGLSLILINVGYAFEGTGKQLCLPVIKSLRTSPRLETIDSPKRETLSKKRWDFCRPLSPQILFRESIRSDSTLNEVSPRIVAELGRITAGSGIISTHSS